MDGAVVNLPKKNLSSRVSIRQHFDGDDGLVEAVLQHSTAEGAVIILIIVRCDWRGKLQQAMSNYVPDHPLDVMMATYKSVVA